MYVDIRYCNNNESFFKCFYKLFENKKMKVYKFEDSHHLRKRQGKLLPTEYMVVEKEKT